MRAPVLAAFGRGGPIRIAIVNAATRPLGCDPSALVNALTVQAVRDFAPAWGMLPPTLALMAEAPPGWWSLTLNDRSDISAALGYHLVNEHGMPAGFASVEDAERSGSPFSTVVSHELLEMLGDPGIQIWAKGPEGDVNAFYAYETADAVQGDWYEIDGVSVSNFVFPNWFEEFAPPESAFFDHMGLCKRPFQIRPGGYMPVYRDGRGYDQVFGDRPDGSPPPMPKNRVKRRLGMTT